MAAPTPAKHTFTGSCHCGFIKYTAAVALTDSPTASRCNCTICLKQGYTSIRITPEDFTLLSPESASQVKDYQMKSKDIHKYFCGTCGIHVWSEGEFVYEGKKYPLFSVNILTLDQPQEGLDLSKVKIQYFDGRNDNWMAGPRGVPWPGQCI
ncbi:Mss4-like protein [Exophiala viscosa]|uniref:Mss4-like protein n=1 Tax=Exophiala viscosa TaxID=2486360 RepID=A0AAN6DZG7_9EURO|nr:Mss4-like protein [Exophiala viscosa]KAI1622293.1 Mss4-like protein [Exophiala viscosa]